LSNGLTRCFGASTRPASSSSWSGYGGGADTVLVDDGSISLRVLGLPRLIAVKARAGRPKDRAVLPVLVATLDEQTRAKG
jgi:hypothetical protein